MAPLFFGCEPFEPIRFTITQSAKSEIGILVKYALGAIDPHLPKLYWASQAYTAYMSLKNYRLCLAARLFFFGTDS